MRTRGGPATAPKTTWSDHRRRAAGIAIRRGHRSMNQFKFALESVGMGFTVTDEVFILPRFGG
jgi:hypothetical protein